jgi:hypothetical protein
VARQGGFVSLLIDLFHRRALIAAGLVTSKWRDHSGGQKNNQSAQQQLQTDRQGHLEVPTRRGATHGAGELAARWDTSHPSLACISNPPADRPVGGCLVRVDNFEAKNLTPCRAEVKDGSFT